MVKVTYIEDEYISNIKIKGHADYDAIGKDIVCASVSSMATLAFNTCEMFDENVVANYVNEILEINLDYYNKEIDTVLKTFISLLKELCDQYPSNISIHRRWKSC